MSITYEELKFPVYLNNRIVGTVGGVPLTVSDAINAAQLVGNNVFLGGKKGSGKTQLLTDLYRNRYGRKGKVLEGRPDLKADEIYKTFSLERLRSGALTSDELIELTQGIHYHFVGVDELTRAPEVSQNELLSIMNGYILHKGEPAKLGDGFSVGIATGNLGNGGYVGTFKIDDAMSDRLHLFLDLDFWKPTDEDMAEIDFRTDIDPRVVDASVRDITDKIRAAHQEIQQRKIPFEVTIIGRYLERALDYCKQFPFAGNSKDNLKDTWPAICTQKNCNLRDTKCGKVKSISERTVRSAKKLAQGLQYVAELKQEQAEYDPLGAMLTAAKLILPYSGSISSAYLREDGIFGNPNIAAQELVVNIEKDIKEQFLTADGKPGPLTIAYAYALQGEVKPDIYTDGEWKFVKPQLERIPRGNNKR